MGDGFDIGKFIDSLFTHADELHDQVVFGFGVDDAADFLAVFELDHLSFVAKAHSFGWIDDRIDQGFLAEFVADLTQTWPKVYAFVSDLMAGCAVAGGSGFF